MPIVPCTRRQGTDLPPGWLESLQPPRAVLASPTKSRVRVPHQLPVPCSMCRAKRRKGNEMGWVQLV
eukprot:365868-Chlamydomonas_euryale.AAC.4